MTVKIPGCVSQHLKLMTAISSIFVVFIHATTMKYDNILGPGPYTWIGKLENYFSYNIFHIALSIFFLNSAFFLFLNVKTIKEILPRMQKRGITLLMPYLAWSGLWMFLGFFFGFLPDLSASSMMTIWVLNPLPGQLWFLRDLISLVILAPLFLLLPTRILAIVSALIWAWWFQAQTVVVIDSRSNWYEMISNEALSWFLLGALGARHASAVLEWIRKGFPPYILIIVFGLWVLAPLISLPMQMSEGLSVTAGTLFWLGLAPYMRSIASSHQVSLFASYGFVIYLGHHPAVGLFQKQLLQGVAGNQFWHFGVYLIAPLLIIALLMVVFFILSKFAPKIVYIANGGRPLPNLFVSAKKGNS